MGTPLRKGLSASFGLLPGVVAAAWMPLRTEYPNLDVAIPLVLAVGVVALAWGRGASLVATVTAAAAFDLFDSPPYGQLSMTRDQDVVTTFVLLGAGALVGEVSVRVRAYRLMAAQRKEDFTVMTGAAHLMALGEDASTVVGALAGELVSSVGVADCEFRYGPPRGDCPYVGRDGSLLNLAGGGAEQSPAEIDLPVWAGSSVVGRYRLVMWDGDAPSPDRLLVAIGIAEQAGAALATAPAEPTSKPSRLHLLR
jgi:Domain of unknown function (DUF4118)